MIETFLKSSKLYFKNNFTGENKTCTFESLIT